MTRGAAARYWKVELGKRPLVREFVAACGTRWARKHKLHRLAKKTKDSILTSAQNLLWLPSALGRKPEGYTSVPGLLGTAWPDYCLPPPSFPFF